MAEYSKNVPRDPNNCDETLKAVLEAIIFFTADGDELISYQIKPQSITLTFEAVD